MSDKADRDIEKDYPKDQFVDKLRRLADAIENDSTKQGGRSNEDEQPLEAVLRHLTDHRCGASTNFA